MFLEEGAHPVEPLPSLVLLGNYNITLPKERRQALSQRASKSDVEPILCKPVLALSEPNCTWRILQSHTDAIFDCESSLTALM